MSFSYKFKTLKSGSSYDSRTQPKMWTYGDENTGEAHPGMIEGREENSTRFSLELVDEGMKTSLEPLYAQIFTLAEMMHRLIQNISAKDSTTPSSRGFWHQ